MATMKAEFLSRGYSEQCLLENFSLRPDHSLLYLPPSGEATRGAFYQYTFRTPEEDANLKITFGAYSAPIGENPHAIVAHHYAEILYNHLGELIKITTGQMFETPELGASAVIVTKRDPRGSSWNHEILVSGQMNYNRFLDATALNVLLQDQRTSRVKHVRAPRMVPIHCIESAAISANPRLKSPDGLETWKEISTLAPCSLGYFSANYDVSLVVYPLTSDIVMRTEFLPEAKNTQLAMPSDPEGNVVYVTPHRT